MAFVVILNNFNLVNFIVALEILNTNISYLTTNALKNRLF